MRRLLQGKVALVTGGDSGIGRAVCYYFSLEGATMAFTYVEGQEDQDANDALDLIKQGKTSDADEPLAITADLRSEEQCKEVIDKVVNRFGRIDVLVNNAGVQYYNESIEEVTEEQLRMTFEINIFAYFFLAKYAFHYFKSDLKTKSSLFFHVHTHIYIRMCHQNMIIKSKSYSDQRKSPIFKNHVIPYAGMH